MKKLCVCLALIMGLFCASAYAQTMLYTCPGLFSIGFDSAYMINTTDEQEVPDDEYDRLFFLESDDCIIDCVTFDWTDTYGEAYNLYEQPASEMKTYIKETADSYGAKYITTITAKDGSISIPFPVFMLRYDNDGDPYTTYWAETVIGSLGVTFELYDAGSASLSKLETLLSGFRLDRGASSSLAQTGIVGTPFSAKGLFTVTLPADYDIDTESYKGDSDETYQWLFWAENEVYAIDCGVYNWQDVYETFSLFSASDDEMDAYIKDTLEFYEEYDATYMTTLYATYNNAKIPFVVFHMNYTEDGDDITQTYNAETIVNGYGIYFEIYDADQGALDVLEELLNTFTPDV